MGASVGIYIGTENVEIVSLTGSFTHPRLVGQDRARLPAHDAWRSQTRLEGPSAPSGSPESPAFQEQERALTGILLNLLEKAGAHRGSSKIHVVIPAEAVVIRYFQMPVLPVNERRPAVSFEAKRYLPFKIEELSTDHQIILQRTDPATMRVVFFGMRQTASEAYAAISRAAKIVPESLEPAPLSLMRILQQSGQLATGQVAAILSIERDSATINIARPDLLYLSRNISISIPPPAGASVEVCPPELMDALVSETRVSIDYYRRRFLGEPPIQKILFLGKPEELKRLQELSMAFDLPLQAVSPFVRITGAAGLAAGLAIAAGAALRGLDRRGRAINLLPEAQRRPHGNLMQALVLEGLAAALALGSWYGMTALDLHAIRQRSAAVAWQQGQPQGTISTDRLEELSRQRTQLQTERNLLERIVQERTPVSVLLGEISRLLPQEAWIETMSFSESFYLPEGGLARPVRRARLQMAGNVFSGSGEAELARVNQIVESLQNSEFIQRSLPEFSLNSAQRASYQEETVTHFSLTLTSEPSADAASQPPTRPRTAPRRPSP